MQVRVLPHSLTEGKPERVERGRLEEAKIFPAPPFLLIIFATKQNTHDIILSRTMVVFFRKFLYI